ncbi:GFA family protein [Rhodobacterales bacterium HKCCE3408]|nr:GFA family protein [Rhodobacterales bacterium HKCCE3408]
MPLSVVYCHCQDCRRWSGAPVSCFAAFEEGEVTVSPSPRPPVSANPGVARWFCRACGSPVAAQFSYLPGQIYVPIGILDQAGELYPDFHGFEAERLPWLHIADSAERMDGTVRARVLSRFRPGRD